MKLAYRFSAFAAAAAVLFCAATAQAEEDRDIFTAARLGDVQQMAGLLDADPDLVDARTPTGETPLHYAAMGRSVAAVDLLLQRGADVAAVDDAGRTALHVAATSNDPALMARLLEAGANVSATDNGGETPLHLAARRFQPRATAALLAAGANPNAQNVDGRTPLHVLGSAARDADGVQAVIDALAQTLIAAGADPALLDHTGASAWPHPTEEPGMPRQPSGYPSYDSIVATLLARATTYPSLCQRVDLGPSSTTPHIFALKISDNVGVEEDEPEFKWISTMHGNETSGAIMCLNLIDYLLTNYGSVPRVTNIVDSMEIWIVPVMNPYGYTNNTRYNANGYDLNRSFPEGSGPSPDPNPNPSSGRQPEVATIINWSFAHSFTLAANLHEGVIVANYPFDNDNMGSVFSPTPDEDLFVYISEQYSFYNSTMWNNPEFPPHGITNGAEWYAIDGGMQDWDYRYMGGNEVTFEISNPQSPPYSQMPTYWSLNRDSMLAYMETCLIGVRGIVTGLSGEPVAATVTVAGRNHPIYTDPDVGDYHRMLMPGTYNLTFTSAGHTPITVNNVVVGAGAATRLDVSWGPQPPTATGASLQTPASTPLTVTLQATDDGLPVPPGALTYIVTSLPAHGTLAEPGSGTITTVPHTVVNGSHQVVYTPVSYQGLDSFQFKANDGGAPPQGGDSNIATISVTVGIPQVVYSFPLTTNPGWTTQGQWAWGTPTGGSGDHGGPDPTSGHTGTKVYGYNLSGGYASGIPEYHLTTTAINCTNLTQVSLKFWRWLGVEQRAYDHAYVRVSNNGTSWTTVWQNPTTDTAETAWSQQSYDISAVANNKATVYVRWTMGTTDSAFTYCGWNIDDVEIWGLDSTPSDTTPPTPNPMTFATAPAPTSTSAIGMTATTATDATTPPVSYYFNFVSGGSGGNDSAWQSATTYTNSGLAPDTAYTYRVKARDSANPPNETSYSSNATATTWANVPAAPTLGGATTTTMTLDVNVNGNPAATVFAVRCTAASPGDANWVGQYASAAGAPSAAAVWQTDAAWGVITIQGLQSGTTYTFAVKARNQDGVETAFGAGASLATTTTVTGACCYDAAPCAILTEAACTPGGVYQGNGTACTPQLCCPAAMGDLNGDTYVDGADIQGFVDAMLAGFNPCADLAEPYDTLDTADLSAFVDLLLGV